MYFKFGLQILSYNLLPTEICWETGQGFLGASFFRRHWVPLGQKWYLFGSNNFLSRCQEQCLILKKVGILCEPCKVASSVIAQRSLPGPVCPLEPGLPLGVFNKVKVKVTQSCPTLQPHRLYSPWNFPGQNTGVGSLFLLQWIFPTRGLNRGLLRCRQILYQLSYQGSPMFNKDVDKTCRVQFNWLK